MFMYRMLHSTSRQRAAGRHSQVEQATTAVPPKQVILTAACTRLMWHTTATLVAHLYAITASFSCWSAMPSCKYKHTSASAAVLQPTLLTIRAWLLALHHLQRSIPAYRYRGICCK
jgi:hypothetical protein